MRLLNWRRYAPQFVHLVVRSVERERLAAEVALQDGDGFLEYERRSPRGLRNQGWKDSDEAIRYPDGKIVTGPIATVVVDCADPRTMARFWGKAMDWTLHQVTDHNAVLSSAKGVGPYLQFLRTPDVKTVWNRVHLDLRPYPGDDPEAEAARLRTLGATAIDLGQSDVPWMVLADPEGNEFCLLAPG